eukprot:gene2701-2952_t
MERIWLVLTLYNLLFFLVVAGSSGRQSRVVFKSSLLSVSKDGSAEGGEDAAWVLPQALAVFDGVGGWSLEGINSGIFSRTLAKHSQHSVKLHHRVLGEENATRFLVLMLRQALTQCIESNLTGSSTACLAFLDGAKSMLHVANIGDSGLMVLRRKARYNAVSPGGGGDYEMVFETQPQWHSFNTPYQLGHDSRNPTSLYDSPESGRQHSIRVLEGDVVLLCTDGLLDNIFTKDLIAIINRNQGKGIAFTQSAVREIVETARCASLGRSNQTPWSEREGRGRLGGKPDDITVIVSLIEYE